MTEAEEVPLAGGFSNVVTRRGGTVRRQVGPWTPAVHALLKHVRSVGFTLAPEPLGVDEDGREVLSFIDGQVAWWPWPAALRRDEGLRAVAGMLRELEGALATFNEPAGAIWHGGPRSAAEDVIRHGDLAPWNTLWVGDRLTGLIDWDTAEPAPPGWDAAQGAWYFIPLRPLVGYRSEGLVISFADVRRRLRIWCSELDLDPAQLLDTVGKVQQFEQDRIVTRGAACQEPYATFLARGDAADIEGDRTWLREHRAALLSD